MQKNPAPPCFHSTLTAKGFWKTLTNLWHRFICTLSQFDPLYSKQPPSLRFIHSINTDPHA